MFNTSVYQGTDGILTLNAQENTPGASLITDYLGEGGVVGRLKNVSLNVTTAIRAFYELGSRAPKELRAANLAISGSVERAYINGALLKLLLGDYAISEEGATPFKAPDFNIVITLDNLNLSGDNGNSILTIYNVLFDSWQFSLPEDDFVLERLTFKARRVAVEDKSLS